MAIAIRSGEEAFQVQMVCLDELVPQSDVLRRVERLVDWEFVRETARPFYSEFGRPGVDPVVLVKVFLVAAIRGIDSMRETLRVAEVDLAIRRFLGYGLTERLPHHATFSYAQCVRFASSSVFEQLFNQVLASCRDAGLLDGTRLIVDGTHVEANAALKSLRAELEVIDGGGEGSESSASSENGVSAEAPADPRPRLELAAPRSGPTPKRKASNVTAVSRTDPDAKLRYKPGHRPHLVHRAQVATDPKHRVIVAVRAESALGHEADSLPIIIDRARWLRHRVDEIVADAGYASAGTYAMLQERGITTYIPPQPNMRKTAHGQAARTRCKSPVGVGAAVDRITHGEGAIAEMKRHGAGRARCRGTAKVQIQLLLAATAINLKRLISRLPAAENTAAGDQHGQPAAIDAENALNHAHPAAIAAHLQIINTCLRTLNALDRAETLGSTTGS